VSIQPDWFAIAVGVTPSFPCSVVALRDDGAPVRLTLTGARDGVLSAQTAVSDARKGQRFNVLVESERRGGYAITCTTEETFFLGGLDAEVSLMVTDVKRRKPYRVKDRAQVAATAALSVIHAAQRESGTQLHGRVHDVSVSGIGISPDIPLTVGDRLHLETTISVIPISIEVFVRSSGRMAFGRCRAGCEFLNLPPHTAYALETLVAQRNASHTQAA
jgi:hypothetical protein